MKRPIKSTLKITIIVLVVLFAVIQFIPYGRDHHNPAVIGEPDWDHPTTRQLAKTACFDCHSNETVWPWYSHVAPVSWLVQRDVEKGRKDLNFSRWADGENEELEEAAEEVREGEMPMPIYLLTHGDARLSNAQKEQLIRGFLLTASPGERLPRSDAQNSGDED